MNGNRDEMESQNAALGANVFDQISRERYLGYIACTRANKKLTLTFSKQSTNGKTLNPSSLIAQVKNIFPELAVEEFSSEPDWRAAEHPNELVVPLLQSRAGVSPAPANGNDELLARSRSSDRRDAGPIFLEIPALKLLAEKLGQLREPDVGKSFVRTHEKTLRRNAAFVGQSAGGICGVSV